MKIIVAVDNQKLKEEIDLMYQDSVYNFDIDYMEGVIEYLVKNRTTDAKKEKKLEKESEKSEESEEKKVLITKDNLKGNLTNITYIKQIKLADPSVKIVLFVTSLNQEYKQFLFANEIFNIIESESITKDELKACIEADKSVIYKPIVAKSFKDVEDTNDIESKNKEAIKLNVSPQVITKQLIAIYGTNGAGKTYFSNVLAHSIARKLNIKIALLDMDIQNSSLDVINSLDFMVNSLNLVAEDIDKDKNINQSIKNNVVKDSQNPNLSYFTNNCSLYECQNKFSNSYYQKIYNECENIFDYVIVDLPSSPFIDVVNYTLINASKIFFVINPNYLAIRQALKTLDMMTKLWDISKDNIYIVVNKFQRQSLDIDQIKSLLEGFKVVIKIDFDYMVEGYINGANALVQHPNLDDIYKLLFNNNLDKYNLHKRVLFSSIITNFKKAKEKKSDNKPI